jgi:hypothetical protein
MVYIVGCGVGNQIHERVSRCSSRQHWAYVYGMKDARAQEDTFMHVYLNSPLMVVPIERAVLIGVSYPPESNLLSISHFAFAGPTCFAHLNPSVHRCHNPFVCREIH